MLCLARPFARHKAVLRRQSKKQIPVCASCRVAKQDQNGSLDKLEVKLLLDSLGYETPDSYVQHVLELFSSNDADGDGLIDFGEFRPLWEQLAASATAHAVTETLRTVQTAPPRKPPAFAPRPTMQSAPMPLALMVGRSQVCKFAARARRRAGEERRAAVPPCFCRPAALRGLFAPEGSRASGTAPTSRAIP